MHTVICFQVSQSNINNLQVWIQVTMISLFFIIFLKKIIYHQLTIPIKLPSFTSQRINPVKNIIQDLLKYLKQMFDSKSYYNSDFLYHINDLLTVIYQVFLSYEIIFFLKYTNWLIDEVLTGTITLIQCTWEQWQRSDSILPWALVVEPHHQMFSVIPRTGRGN